MWHAADMDKTTIYLPIDLDADLTDIAQRSGRARTEVIQDALIAYLAQQKRLLPKTFGIVSSGKVQGADIEQWLAENWKPDW
jgi:predicted transcriptional regulator